MQNLNKIMLAMVIFLLSTSSQAPALGIWPDTGQGNCYNANVSITCPSNGEAFYGQDAQHLGSQPSYTKLDGNGNALPDSTGTWSMVRDNITALTWEVKTDDNTIHDKDARYYWCNSACIIENNTEAFINSLNSARFGGYDDWRLPSLLELATLLNSGTRGPAINTTFFPNTSLPDIIFIDYWSTTEDTDFSTNAWYVDFADGGAISSLSKNSALRVRAVRGGTAAIPIKYTNNPDATVTDTETGLMWQQDPSFEVSGISGIDNLNWQSALDYVARLNLIVFAGHSDWRLPNRNELQSLVDYSRALPALDTDFFPTPPFSFPWWSSTTEHGMADKAWTVDFAIGASSNWLKLSGGHVRAVRTTTFPLSVTRTGNGSGTISSSPAGISCGSDCSEEYESNTTVSLTATADSGFLFAGWSGACFGKALCTVTMDQSRSVTATFIDPSSANAALPAVYHLLFSNAP